MKRFHPFIIAAISIAVLLANLGAHQEPNDPFQRNLEALASTETYCLSDCQFGTLLGSDMVYSVFCDDLTSPYRIHDCAYAYKAPLPIWSKCVAVVY